MNQPVQDFEGSEITVGSTVKVRYSAVATGVHHRTTLTGIIDEIEPSKFAGGFGTVTVRIVDCSNKTLKHHLGHRMTVYSSHVILA